jgi:hypothetical protein
VQEEELDSCRADRRAEAGRKAGWVQGETGEGSPCRIFGHEKGRPLPSPSE